MIGETLNMLGWKEENNDITVSFLNQISKHLSGRKDCRKIEYLVMIRDNIVKMDPHFEVYPDKYHRKTANKDGVLEHIFKYHVGSDVSLSDGTYIYRLSTNGKSRRWERLNRY